MSNPFVAVAEVQAFGTTQADPVVQLVLDATYRRVERHCDRCFLQTTAVDPGVSPTDGQVPAERYEGNGKARMFLRRYPVTAITSIHYWSSLVGADEYVLEDAERGILRALLGGCWPIDVPANCDITGDPVIDQKLRPLQISYTGGYDPNATSGLAEFPADLKLILITETLATLLENPDPDLLEVRTAGGWLQRWQKSDDPELLSLRCKRALVPFKRTFYR